MSFPPGTSEPRWETDESQGSASQVTSSFNDLRAIADVERESDSRSTKTLTEQTVAQRLQHFTWPWFACSMSTGSLAVVLSQQPYAFPGLDTIGKIFFIIDLVLLVCFVAAITYRFIHTPAKLLNSLRRPKEGLFFGSFWVTIALVLTCTQQYGVPSCGPWLVRALEILFWIYAGCVVVVAVSQYTTLFVVEHVMVSSVMPTWIFPIYPFLLIGPLASVMIPYQPPQSALNIFIGGVMFQGLGWCVSVFMYTIYLVRLMSSELPPASTRPGMYVSVGPAGYTSAALVALGNQAENVIPRTFLGLDDFDVAASIKVLGILAGMFIWLLAFWFFAVTTISVLLGARKMSFSLNWWALIFPNAGMTLAVIQIGNALDSSGIKAVASALTIMLVLVWFFVAIANVVAVVKKKILWEGQDEDVEDEK